MLVVSKLICPFYDETKQCYISHQVARIHFFHLEFIIFYLGVFAAWVGGFTLKPNKIVKFNFFYFYKLNQIVVVAKSKETTYIFSIIIIIIIN